MTLIIGSRLLMFLYELAGTHFLSLAFKVLFRQDHETFKFAIGLQQPNALNNVSFLLFSRLLLGATAQAHCPPRW